MKVFCNLRRFGQGSCLQIPLQYLMLYRLSSCRLPCQTPPRAHAVAAAVQGRIQTSKLPFYSPLEKLACTFYKPHSCLFIQPRSVMQRLSQALFAVLAVSCALMSTVQSTEMQLTLQPSACIGVEFADLGQKYHYDAQVAVANSSEVNCIR